jgi:hypothetical protein
MTKGFIWDHETGKQLAWIDDAAAVFSAKTGEQVATTRDGQLHSPEGEPLKIYLRSEGESVLPSGDSDGLNKLRKLVE